MINTKIERLYRELQDLLPVAPDLQRQWEQQFMLDFNYNSNHIEGNSLTYGQTQLLLLFGKVQGSANMRDLEEMKAHNAGLKMMQQYASERERPLTTAFIRELNGVILKQDFWKDALTPSGGHIRIEIKTGVYKTRPNSVITPTGERFDYASPEETPALMTDLIEWYNKAEKTASYTPIELASLLHYRYIRIHPFEDGNGRIARLLVNYALLKHDYPAIVIPTAERSIYLYMLNQCDINAGIIPSQGANAALEQIQPLVEYLASILEKTIERYIQTIKEGKKNTPKIQKVASSAALQKILDAPSILDNGEDSPQIKRRNRGLSL